MHRNVGLSVCALNDHYVFRVFQHIQARTLLLFSFAFVYYFTRMGDVEVGGAEELAKIQQSYTLQW